MKHHWIKINKIIRSLRRYSRPAIGVLIEKNAKDKSAFDGVPSGFMALDRVTLGWQLSNIIIIAFVLSMARNIAVNHEQGVAFFSLEMSAVQPMMRLIVAETGIPDNGIKSGRLPPPEQWATSNRPPSYGRRTALYRRHAGPLGLRVLLEVPSSEAPQRREDHHHRLPPAHDGQP